MTKNKSDVPTTLKSLMDGDGSPASRSQITSSIRILYIRLYVLNLVLVWQVVFRHNFIKNYLQDLKVVGKDAPRDSLQSVPRIRVYTNCFDKVMRILDPRYPS